MKKIGLMLTVALFTLGTMTTMQSCKNECKDVTCENAGTCNEDDGTCDCTTGYEGEFCETEERAKFVGSYNASGPIACDVSTLPNYSGTIIIANSSTSVTKITMDFGGGILLTAEVSGTSLTIDPSTVDGFDYTGSGSISGATLSISLTEHDSSIPEDCIFTITGTKQ